MAINESGLTILDGAYGTELIKAGMPPGVCPEKWALANPDAVCAIVRGYRAAGSSIVLTPTLGANPVKLRDYSLENETVSINSELARICRNAAEGVRIYGDISAFGSFVEPFGEMSFDEAVKSFSLQVEGLMQGGVEGFFIETMIDIQQARAAIFAARETGLPVIACMSFDESGYTVSGTDVVSALCSLQNLGIAAFGCNCSAGPRQIASLIKKCVPYAKVPLCAKPNAGKPRLENGVTVFDMGPDEFADSMQSVVDAGAVIVGGCCGTGPDHIRALGGLKPGSAHTGKSKSLIISACRSFCTAGIGEPFRIIGERINPTGKKALQTELLEGSFSTVRRFAQEQENAGASILDVNMGMPGIDEADMMRKAVDLLSKISRLPLSIDTTSPAVARNALRLYPGRALFNSIAAEKERLEKVLPLAAQYGAAFIALPLDDTGIPDSATKRMKCLERIMNEAAGYGITKSDVMVDALVMTIGSDKNAALVTLELIELCAKEGFATVCGLSNVSFGLPGRDYINAAFLSAAASRGLTCAIANPSSDKIMNSVQAINLHKEAVKQS